MNNQLIYFVTALRTSLLAAVFIMHASAFSHAAVMNDYCVRPPFVGQQVPPMVMFDVGRDHKLYYEAYNDGVDLDGDGRIETTYNHSIEYYGYFNPYKCYTHSGGTANNARFSPAASNSDRFCSSGQWSGNMLNWLTMSRMDVLRKVMYGGQRVSESPATVLSRAYIPQDAHSWGKEYTGKLCTSGSTYKNMCSTDSDCDSGYSCTDKSLSLIGSAAPSGGTLCTATNITWGTANGDAGKGKLLVTRYPRISSEQADDHEELMERIDYSQFFASTTPTYITDYDGLSTNIGEQYTTAVVSEFYVANNKGGDWRFAIDGDDEVEIEVRNIANGNIVKTKTTNLDQVGWYGGHGKGDNQDHNGTYSLAEQTWYRMIVRHGEMGGDDSVKVWFKRPGDNSWYLFGQSSRLDVRAPNVTVGTNDCTLLSQQYITTGTPTSSTTVTAQKRHLFCNTTLSSGVPTSSTSTNTILRMITNSSHRIWEWASKERPVCDDTFSNGDSATANRTDYTVQVEVCNTGVGTLSETDKFERCRSYGGTYKPVGLFQLYGEYKDDGSGISKVCSKSMGKPCGNDNDCGTGEGLCFDKAQMYFGFMTTSYTKNTSGGVLHKNPGPVSDEVNMNNGTQQTSENTRGNLIMSMDRLQTIDFDYGSRSYSNCGWITDRSINEGECKMWGNPIAEIMYESLRYFAGKGTPVSEFTYSTPADSGVNLVKPAWGYDKGSANYKPYEIYPTCSQPFVLLLSDVNTSYDSDQIPGSSYTKPDGSSFTEDALTPALGLGTLLANGRTLLNDLTRTIGQTEGINGSSWFVGESDGSTDFICSAKPVTDLSQVRGICPEEPTKKGSFYSAALAYYGKTQFQAKTGMSPVSTFVVALSSPFADIRVKAGSGFVNVVPVAKSVSGCSIGKCLGYSSGGKTCTLSTAANGNNSITNCPSDAFCPTNSLVDFYIDNLKYNSSNEVVYVKFRINFEDVEQGADHDMDAIATYELCTQAASDAGYGSCGGTISGLQVKVSSDYAAGCIDQLMGFVISGTTEDGTYLVVKDVDTGSGPISGLPITWSKTFSVSSAGAAGFLKSPLWYAAKWGGFRDLNGNNIPDQRTEWARNCTSSDITKCNPDNYFPVSNPLELDEQLRKALEEILARVASGTAASILNNSEGSGANLLQAVFYPKKPFDDGTEANWIGELQNLWYFLDPALQKTSIREDTNRDNKLNLKQDKVAQFYFDASQNQTLVKRFTDADGDGAADNPSSPDDTVSPDYVNSLWKAGRMLWERNISDSSAAGTATYDPRTIFTGYGSTTGNTPQKFSNLAADGYFNTWPNVWTLLQIPAGTDAQRTAAASALISYVHGIDQTGSRSRKVTILGCGLTDTPGCSREWKLGDIVSSTPKLVSNVKLNNYNMVSPTGYNDLSYESFISTSTYLNRGMAFVGGNDGMLHAFRLGVLKELNQRYDKAQINDSNGNRADAADKIGREEWAFIPRNALPYLKYLPDPNYNHLFYVDKTPSVFDASIGKPATCSTDYSDCAKASDGSTWRTVLVGGMGFGGASANNSSSCSTSTECVQNPIANSGYSSYFALDVTDPANPKYLWEFPDATLSSAATGSLGYSTTGPAIVRIARKDASGHPDHNKNGKWFAIFASGPTGPIDTTKHEFKGASNQNLKLFIVDLASGSLVKTIDTGIANAFAGSLYSSVIDTDRSNSSSDGYYSDDAIYIGYVQKDTSVTPNTWTKGGVIRLLTRESDDPASTVSEKQWAASTLVSNTGPVTSSITKLQDKNNNLLWIYFGTGRFFFKGDDPSTTVKQKLYGIKEPCYSTAMRQMQFPVAGGTHNDISQTCSDAVTGTLTDQSGTAALAPAATLAASSPGWFIELDPLSGTSMSERVITDPVASPSGTVFFTTFKPNSDICMFGGQSLIWAVNYATGGTPNRNTMQGKALMQVSTGAFAELSLSTAFRNDGNARLDGRRLSVPISGVPPTAQGLSLITNPPPKKKMLHVREK